MTWDEYNLLFHKQQLNLVAFKRLMDCDEEVLRLVNSAIEAEREACAKVCEETDDGTPYNLAEECARNIRARGKA
jgi:alpha-mannosidase